MDVARFGTGGRTQLSRASIDTGSLPISGVTSRARASVDRPAGLACRTNPSWLCLRAGFPGLTAFSLMRRHRREHSE